MLFCIPDSTGRWSAFFCLFLGRVAGLGEKVSADAMVFGLSLCTSKRMLKEHHAIARQYDALSYAVANFLQLFLWRGFLVVPTMPCEFKVVKTQLVDAIERVKTSHLKSRG